MGHPVWFGVVAFIAIAAALGMLTSRNAVHSALYLVLNFSAVAVLYIILNAPFIAMVQVTVYAGAIMVLFLFVIMLLGAERLGGPNDGSGGWQRPFAIILAAVLVVCMFVALSGNAGDATNAVPPLDSSPANIGTALFESYVFPFEVTSILLLVAMISLVVWRTQKKKD